MIEVIKGNMNIPLMESKKERLKMEKKNQYLKDSQEKQIVEVKEKNQSRPEYVNIAKVNTN